MNWLYDDANLEEAFRYEIGVTLFTRDGSKIGNAIITGHDPVKDLWEVETDFGNKVKNFSMSELDRLFKLGHVYTVDKWRLARQRAWEDIAI